MGCMDKTVLSEADIISKFILPAIKKAGWDAMTQIRQEVKLRDGKVVVRGQMSGRKTVKSADIVLYYKPHIPLAVIEAKANKYDIGKGIQQGLGYAQLLAVPFIFASNGDGFVFHDKAVAGDQPIETKIELENFPSPEQLWQKFVAFKGYTDSQLPTITQDYHDSGSNKAPRYYQLQAINKTLEAITSGKDRILLVMATGTGKTYTAFQIIWRLWKAKQCKRILFLADRNVLVDQARNNDFQPFGQAMTKIKGRRVDPAYEVHLALYQALTGPEEEQKAYKQVRPDFFDLIVIDECHRGSAADDSVWREILEYFSSATQIGLTATPKETEEVSNIDYFGEPIYTYSLKEGIEDGFLAPYKVVRVDLDVDVLGWRPEEGQVDDHGAHIDDRIYNTKDFDRSLIIAERTDLVAKTISAYLQRTDPMAKTIVFCIDIDHAGRMRQALINHNPEQVKKNDKYVMKITGDDDAGKAQLDNFINPKKAYPVIATTSELMTTGVDAKTCKLIVLDQNIQSMTKFKQIIGRGTRIDERHNKFWFTILDFRKATELFADPAFDGDAEHTEVTPEDIINGDGGWTPDDEPEAGDYGAPPTDDGTEIPESPDSPYEGDPYEGDWGEKPTDIKPFIKFRVSGVVVKKLAERVQYYDADGKLVTESFKDYTRKTVMKRFASLDDFVKTWKAADKKQAIVKELELHGVIWKALESDISKDMGPFDIICHLVFDQPALTRRERANNVKKRNYFSKYSEVAQKVLHALLDKYADNGIMDVESIQILKVVPFVQMGLPKEIVDRAFGGKRQYEEAVRDLENALFDDQQAGA